MAHTSDGISCNVRTCLPDPSTCTSISFDQRRLNLLLRVPTDLTHYRTFNSILIWSLNRSLGRGFFVLNARPILFMNSARQRIQKFQAVPVSLHIMTFSLVVLLSSQSPSITLDAIVVYGAISTPAQRAKGLTSAWPMGSAQRQIV